ncbi:hypothetical protein PSTH1771_28115 [Pseudomonas syringae pv. theae]|uniref:DUF7716 domain-containing protein n=1 Tax=Pseudomonas syringae TaxID=317 RepID=UPI001EBABBC9|nr:hypothetical protein [Pseudomonas syringae]NAT16027.1 hypothetical protein [Pseudomonas syringae pv. actinidifoliorum]MBL3832362.1 hypothetical protein [Pseudomonas syringae pv. theae]MBL3870559.1 hypothetical protein [Pseudomonas syringae pv. theae]NAT59546.1 hypothetical protein [Pseudomonas syringae pv. actinidifoliorum]GKQ49103.1 hypothetical protein PSTH2693_28125 [Pseudomonas syringae pv. theae]
MKTYSIKEVLLDTSKMPDSWFYLPDTPWTLDTKGAFSLDSRDFPSDSKDYLPPQVLKDGWKEVLETSIIEDVISNVDEQLSEPTIDDYFDAFKFYYENDAFKVFKC